MRLRRRKADKQHIEQLERELFTDDYSVTKTIQAQLDAMAPKKREFFPPPILTKPQPQSMLGPMSVSRTSTYMPPMQPGAVWHVDDPAAIQHYHVVERKADIARSLLLGVPGLSG